MKETYFKAKSINVKAQEMIDSVGAFRRHNPGSLAPKTALLVMDMQQYFLNPTSHAFIPSAPAIVPGLRNLIESFRRSELPVIFTRHVNTDDDSALMKSWWQDLIRPDDELSKIDNSLAPGDSLVIEKTQYDALHQTALEQVLTEQDIRQVVITGVMTHLCCETTARSAFVRGFEVVFAVDGTATYSEEFHRATLLNLAHGFATLATVEEIIKSLRCRVED